MSEEKRMVCVYWGDQAVASAKVDCADCGKAVAMSEGNVEISKKEGIKPICLRCVVKAHDQGEEIHMRGMVKGEESFVDDSLGNRFLEFARKVAGNGKD